MKKGTSKFATSDESRQARLNSRRAWRQSEKGKLWEKRRRETPSVRIWHNQYMRSVYGNKQASHVAQRRALLKSAVPSWFGEFDALVVSEVFALARQRAVATGVAWEVDHIVPLQSKFVCGLHCATNLQVITAKANRQKGNKLLVNRASSRTG